MTVTKRLVFVVIVATLAAAISAKGEKVALATNEELLWPGGVKDGLIKHTEPETMVNRDSKNVSVPNRAISNITEPTITIYPVLKEKATGAAVIIFPGGGYRRVAIDHEGHDVARKFNEMGITGVVVKYRTLPVDPNGRINWARDGAALPAIIADGKRAVRVVRSRAAELGVDPNKIGTAGFSAGGHLVTALMLNAHSVTGNATDRVERVSCRPDFTCMIYPSYDEGWFRQVRGGIGPCFIAIAANDTRCPPADCIRMFQSLQKMGVPAELHIFEGGGHGFGLGKTKGTESTWPDVFAVWLKQNGFARK